MTAPANTTQQLIEECQGLVRSLAWKIHRKLPSSVDVDDLIAYGQIGLAEAARDFDPSRGGKFSTYAYYRIRGAIYDGLGKMTWFGRAQRRRNRYEQMAGEVLKVDAESGDEAVSRSPEDEVSWLKGLTSALAVAYLTTHPSGSDDGEPAAVVDEGTPSPEDAAAQHETCQILQQLISALPDEAGTLIRAAYFEGLTLQEAGQRLGVSKAWASRLHAKTLDRLARSLRLLGISR